MKITVWSVLSGKASGHIIINVPETLTIGDVLDKFLTFKGAQKYPGYVMRSSDNLVLDPHKTLKQSSLQDGETLTLGLSDDEEQTFSFGSWWTVTIMSLLIGIVGLAVILWMFFEPVTAPEKFGVVMDAGSSHSEIFVFSWSGDKPLGTADIKLRHRCFVAGGVNSFATHADDLGRYLGKCLKVAETQVPSHLRKETPIYVGATAGMRILRDFDPEGAVAVLTTLRDFLETNSTFKVQHRNIGIIPGYEEGTSGWIAVNYLIGTLKQEETSTKAALDVGGASAQITSALKESGNWTTRNLTLFNQTHNIQSQSFLCYGIGQAQHRHNFLLVTEGKAIAGDSSNPDIPVDPCLPVGTSHEISELDLNGPCTLTGDQKPELASMTIMSQNKMKKIFKNYLGKGEDEDFPTLQEKTVSPASEIPGSDKKVVVAPPQVIKGSSDAKECDRKIGQLFDLQFCKKTFRYGDCMNAQLVPAVTGDLIAFSGLFYHLMLLLQIEPNTSLDDYKVAVDRVCSLKSEALYAAYPGVDKDIVEDLCFDGMYVYKLLTVGLGINNSSWSNIDFTRQVNGMDIEWPLGFMLNRTTGFPPAYADRPLTISTLSLLIILFSAFLFSGILFLRHSIKIRRHSASYQRVIADHFDHELRRFI
ncbi:ectonucleoside triphosphate diphosphohydrolase 8-like isoform X2 [Penaeus japonicus]|uniref:ectonucleoside triphosphate diphosphohydrolase 8-like isoform X2 n=1 Tax=Penaeus japonicus TaxID=27405 RepID=UPI001C70FE00|nr:ectonucleoside triphosphate diphosphohydrolase 8-like isoform X2 [Penaeus japonicus]